MDIRIINKSLLVIAITALAFIFLYRKESLPTDNSIDNNFKATTAISLMLLDNNAQPYNTPLMINRDNDSITVKFQLSAFSSINTDYDVILLSNYKQKSFSINNSEYKDVHRIHIPATNDVISTTISLQFDDDNSNFKDCILILSPTYEKYKKSNHHFTKRFSLKLSNDISLLPLTKDANNNISDISDINLNGPQALVLTDSDNKALSEASLPNIISTVNLNAKLMQHFSMPIYIRTTDLVDSETFTDFIEKNSENDKHKILIFAISNNRVLPIFDGNDYAIYEISTQNSNIINPNLLFSEAGNYETTFFIVSYPFHDQTSFLKTYRMVFWSTIINTQKTYIEVIDR